MKSRKQPYDEREESIRLAVIRSPGPLSSEELYAIVHPFFSSKRQFSSTMGGMTKRKRVTSIKAKDGKARLYSPPTTGEGTSKPVETLIAAHAERLPRIDEIFTRRAMEFHVMMQARKIKPMMENDPDKEKR